MDNNQPQADTPQSMRKTILTPVKFAGTAAPLMGTGCGDLCKGLARTVKDPGMANIQAMNVGVKNDVSARLHNQLNRTMTPSLTPGK